MSTIKADNIRPQSDSNSLVFSTNGTQRMLVATDGQVNIGGVTTANCTVYIAGKSDFGDVQGVGGAQFTYGGGLLISDSQRAAVKLADSNTQFKAVLGAGDNGSTSNLIIATNNGSGDGYYGNAILMYPGTDREMVRVCSQGLGVSVADSTLYATLDVRGTARISDEGAIPSGGNAIFSAISTVPVTAATTKGITLASFLSNYQGASDYRPRLFVTATKEGIVLDESYNTTANNLMFAIGHVEKMRLTVDGDIGIGTTSPVAKLDIRGTVSISDTGTFPTSSSVLVYNRVLIGGTGPALFLWDDGSSVATGRYSTVALGSRNATSSTMIAGGYIRGGNEGTTDHSGFLSFYTTPTDGNSNRERMRIDSNGDVGIGTGNPLCALHVVTSNGPDFPGILIVNGSGGDDQVAGNCMGLRVQVGDGTGTAKLLDVRNFDATKDHFIVRKNQTHVLSDVASEAYGDAHSGALLISNTANTRQLQIGISHTSVTPNTGYVWIEGWVPTVGGSDIVLQPSGGRVGIGTTTPAYQLQLSTNSAAKPTSTAWTVASDSRVKTVVGEWDQGLEEICSLRPVKYRLNGMYGTTDDGKEHVSVLAQEAMQVMPQMVGTFNWRETEDSDSVELYNLDTNSLQWSLVNAVKELKAIVEAQAARIATLEAK